MKTSPRHLKLDVDQLKLCLEMSSLLNLILKSGPIRRKILIFHRVRPVRKFFSHKVIINILPV